MSYPKEDVKLPTIKGTRGSGAINDGDSNIQDLDQNLDNAQEKDKNSLKNMDVPKVDNDSAASPVHRAKAADPADATDSKDNAKPKPAWKVRMQKLLENKYWTIFMAIITVYALFGDDVRLVATNKGADPVFYILTIFCLLCFTVEILMASIATPEFFMGFYFWLDTIATISLIADIGWIWDLIVGTEDFEAGNAQAASQLARASRGARLGTKAGRIVRIIRLIRLIRIVKLYKHAYQAIENTPNKKAGEGKDAPVEGIQAAAGDGKIKLNKVEENVSKDVSGIPTAQDMNIPEESKVGKKLSDLTTRRVILLVLAMMFSVPAFTISSYKAENNSFTFGLELIKAFEDSKGGPGFMAAYDSYKNEHKDIRTPLILLNVLNEYTWQSDTVNADDLRTSEKEIVEIEDYNYLAIFDLTANTRLTAGLGLCRTLFVCFVLALGALFFSKDANELVISPIENMIQKVNRIAKNPLEAAQEEENEALAVAQSKIDLQGNKKNKKKDKKEGPYETVILEQTIIKIGALLALGFGEAGAKIIADNMAQSGDVDPMIPGVKVVAIFGFCDIRNFTDTTEILQEDVMLFVNEIAEIVHGIVDRYSGAANKNIGDAFLLVWKYSEDDTEFDPVVDNLVPKMNHRVQQIADMSIIAFLKIVAALRVSYKMDKYKRNKELNERMPNYSVKMGFGLHVGWAIEGAIGSDFKIDASYLSPHVNMASRLEAATKQFGVPLLISGGLYDICTDKTKTYIRHIDRVTVKGSNEPIDLMTCDTDINNLQMEKPEKKVQTRQDKKLKKVQARLERNRYKMEAMANQIAVSSAFEDDPEIKKMREGFSAEFFATFKAGFDNYIKGDWLQAKLQFDKVEVSIMFDRQQAVKKQSDYPTRSLLGIMGEHNFQAPKDWEGVRALTEK